MDHVDWSKAQRNVLPNLNPTTNTISLKLSQRLRISIKAAAKRRDVPYQPLTKIRLQERGEHQ